ncbi:hypothetical protein NDU88_003829 [Pleurodeles waltl]|uniref:Uncharacterized protein n=1 Tax=Pleurodeles waltl TaxID=8319 RepID=A0AAV7SH21_PLEWA|nr:hypothetical protein NDU88_003829 [Pleurodeles waltl]
MTRGTYSHQEPQGKRLAATHRLCMLALTLRLAHQTTCRLPAHACTCLFPPLSTPWGLCMKRIFFLLLPLCGPQTYAAPVGPPRLRSNVFTAGRLEHQPGVLTLGRMPRGALTPSTDGVLDPDLCHLQLLPSPPFWLWVVSMWDHQQHSGSVLVPYPLGLKSALLSPPREPGRDPPPFSAVPLASKPSLPPQA